MTTSFERDLDTLTKDLLSMGAQVEGNITRAVTALVDRRAELVEAVIAGDREIDAMEVRIDEHCYQILALHQPVAADLRYLLTVAKINNELERMGDHARNIAKAARHLNGHPPIGVYGDLSEMADRCLVLVRQALESLVQRDIELAEQVRADDKIVDRIHKQTLADLMAEMQAQSKIVPQAVHAIRAARELERIGDIATNIAKDVIFLVKGEIVSHPHLQR